MRASKFRIQNSEFRTLNSCRRRGFTLTEDLITITIIALLAGLGLSAYSGAIEMAREQRTRAQIAKIDQFIMERYEGYRTRAVPLKTIPGNPPRTAAQNRLTALRELMRLEMPDRISDLCNAAELSDLAADNSLNAITSTGSVLSASLLPTLPALTRSYKRRAAVVIASQGGWTTANQGSECLYLILSTMRDGDKSALDFFYSEEIGDTDGDGMKEILDGWGNPIEFLRWPAGYCEQPGVDGAWGIAGVDDDNNGLVDDVSEAGWPGTDDLRPRTPQTRNHRLSPDAFDPAKVDIRWTVSNSNYPNAVFPLTYPYAVYPLIYSSGRDKAFDVSSGSLIYAKTTPPNDPYFTGSANTLPDVGMIADSNGDGFANWPDNITNHDKTTQ